MLKLIEVSLTIDGLKDMKSTFSHKTHEYEMDMRDIEKTEKESDGNYQFNARAFLNPVESFSSGHVKLFLIHGESYRDNRDLEYYVSAHLEIADCKRKITLDLDIHNTYDEKRVLDKLYTLSAVVDMAINKIEELPHKYDK